MNHETVTPSPQMTAHIRQDGAAYRLGYEYGGYMVWSREFPSTADALAYARKQDYQYALVFDYGSGAPTSWTRPTLVDLRPAKTDPQIMAEA